MLVFGTQIHIVTFIFIALEFCMLIFQAARYFYLPQDKYSGWFMTLLILYLLYNITGGLFPDPKIQIPVPVQEMIAYGTGFLLASYFPFYFYRAFDLRSLRWHALFGVPLFLMSPYLVFFVIVYAVNGNLDVDIKYGMIVPFIYAIILLWVIFRAIYRKYQESRDRNKYLEEIAMYCTVTPWLAMTLFGLVEESQLVEVLCTNTGFIIITVIYFWKAAHQARLDYERQRRANMARTHTELFQANCLHFGLTRTEILIVRMLYTGLRNKEAAEKMFVSEETIKKHIQNIFRKTNVKNRSALIHKLQNPHH